MFLYKKIKLQISAYIIINLFLFQCSKDSSKQNEPFEVFLKRSSRELCEKMVSCNASIIRTFPKELQKEVTVEVCEETLLVDFEEKVSLHTDSMKLLAKSCYATILEADCTKYLAFAYGDVACFSLNKESQNMYSKARDRKKSNSKSQ